MSQVCYSLFKRTSEFLMLNRLASGEVQNIAGMGYASRCNIIMLQSQDNVRVLNVPLNILSRHSSNSTSGLRRRGNDR